MNSTYWIVREPGLGLAARVRPHLHDLELALDLVVVCVLLHLLSERLDLGLGRRMLPPELGLPLALLRLLPFHRLLLGVEGLEEFGRLGLQLGDLGLEGPDALLALAPAPDRLDLGPELLVPPLHLLHPPLRRLQVGVSHLHLRVPRRRLDVPPRRVVQ